MTSVDIQKQLYRHFYNYDYKLSNSFIYNSSGECDFFAVSKTGYQVEVEIKVSRSDYAVDFKKPKHKFYKAVFEKRTHLVEDLGRATYADYDSKFGTFTYFIPQNISQCSWWHNEGQKQQIEHKEMLRNWPDFYLRKMQGDLWADNHRIKIHVLDKVHIPHRLYYATPPGLIKPNEVPPYAGLIETDGYLINEIKKAPYIHKREQNITGTLLNKFYYECLDWRSGRKKLVE